MGFADFLSSGLTAATGASAANQQGIANANQINQNNALTTFNLLRQQREDEERKTMMGVQMGQMGASTDYLRAHANAVTNPPEKWNQFEGSYANDPTKSVMFEKSDRSGEVRPVRMGGMDGTGNAPAPTATPSVGFGGMPGQITDPNAPPQISQTPQGQMIGGKPIKDPNTPQLAEAIRHNQATESMMQQRLAASAQAKVALGGKDASQMQMAYSMAKPAIDQLTGYFAKQQNPNPVAQLGSHVPFIGNAIVGATDPDYQKAQQSAEVLATQYVETLPKGRASPQLIATMQKQIAPQMGDTPATRAQKANTIAIFEKALRTRAAAGANAQQLSNNPFSDLLPGTP